MAVLLDLIRFANEQEDRKLRQQAAVEANMRAERDKQEQANKRLKVEQGYRDLADFDQQISDSSLQKNILEQSLSRVQDPTEMHRVNVEIQALGNRTKSLEKMRNLREAMLPYEMVDAGLAKAKAVDLMDAANGLKPQKDTGMATVRRENIIGYDENSEPIKETVTFKVPYTQAGVGESQSNIPAYAPANANMSTYQVNNPMLPNISGDQAIRDSQYVASGGSVMFSPNQPEISAPLKPAPAAGSVRPMNFSNQATQASGVTPLAQPDTGEIEPINPQNSGYVRVRDKITGQTGSIPLQKYKAAEASGRYEQIP